MIDLVIPYRDRSIGSMNVRRVLPYAKRRSVGPFVFVDDFGPVEVVRGEALDVLPHPHIGLATVTYLFKGAMTHRDSIGSHQVIVPGEVNWMTAGSGIAHSERVSDAPVVPGDTLVGIQTWVALPESLEETAPSFAHYGVNEIPFADSEGFHAKVILGEAFGLRSPVTTVGEPLYVECRLRDGQRLPLPVSVEEVSLYVLNGELLIEGVRFQSGTMVVFKTGTEPEVQAAGDARFMIIGGARLEKPRFMWWNFVSSRVDRIEQAKIDWAEQRIGKIPGDSDVYIPLPDVGNPNPRPQPL